MDKEAQLMEVLAHCRSLGTEVSYHPEYKHFTAMIWEDQKPAVSEAAALSIQNEIQQRSAQYPGLVCYCFDPFSTLIYSI